MLKLIRLFAPHPMTQKNIYFVLKNCSTATSLRNQFYSILWCVVFLFTYNMCLLVLEWGILRGRESKTLLLCVSLCQSDLFEFVIFFFYIFYYSPSVLLVFNEALFFSSIIHRMQEHLSRTYPWIQNWARFLFLLND